jgi:hypothetical protein
MRTAIVTSCCYDWPTNTSTTIWGLLDKYTGAQREWRIFQQGEDIHLTVGGVPLGVYEERSATGFNAVANTWTHAAVVYNAWVFTVYKDGVSVATSGNFSVTAMGNRTAQSMLATARLAGRRNGWRVFHRRCG